MQRVRLMEEIIVLPLNIYQGGACWFIYLKSTMRHSCLKCWSCRSIQGIHHLIIFQLSWKAHIKWSTVINLYCESNPEIFFSSTRSISPSYGITGRRVYKTGQTWFQHGIFVSIFNVKHGKEKIMLVQQLS